jgi:hypothetical protein
MKSAATAGGIERKTLVAGPESPMARLKASK